MDMFANRLWRLSIYQERDKLENKVYRCLMIDRDAQLAAKLIDGREDRRVDKR
jgi:hypothetical protein